MAHHAGCVSALPTPPLQRGRLQQKYCHYRRAVSHPLQALDLISIAQQTGDISADAYHQHAGLIQPPRMAGLEESLAQAQTRRPPSQGAPTVPQGSSSFMNGAGSSHSSPEGGFKGAIPPGLPLPLSPAWWPRSRG